MKKLLIKISILLSFNIFSEVDKPLFIPMIPLIPALPNEEITIDNNGEEIRWKLQNSYTINLDTKVIVTVPLEIISDIDIKALIVDDENLTIPFELEMNKKPEKENFYTLNYSEKELDIDGDGLLDTYIYSPKYINKKLITDNYLYIDGKNITYEGIHKKKVYITVELNERREL